MAAYRVYKFRGHDYFVPLHLAMTDFDGSVFHSWFPFRVQLQGDLYLPDGETFEKYVASALAASLVALYAMYDDIVVPPLGSELSASNFAFYGPPRFQDRVSVTSYVEPTTGETEVVYRRARLRGDVLFFILSPSAEVEDGEVHLGPLVRPAPRPLVHPEVAAKFRQSHDCGCPGSAHSAE